MKNIFTKENVLTAVGVIIVILALMYAPSIKKENTSEPSQISPSRETTSSVGIANPASQTCVAYGYRLLMRKDENGGEVGYCVFPDGTECEEWSFFRGECGKEKKIGKMEQFPEFGIPFGSDGGKYAGCPEWVNCMPKIGQNEQQGTCVIPPECEGYTQRAY